MSTDERQRGAGCLSAGGGTKSDMLPSRLMPWTCPTCGSSIRHSDIEEQPRLGALYADTSAASNS